MNAEQERHRIAVVKEALKCWDPIGVIPGLIEDGLPPGEYDSYALSVYSNVESAKNHKDISGYLVFLRTSSMEIGINKASEHEIDISKKLLEWRDNGYGDAPSF